MTLTYDEVLDESVDPLDNAYQRALDGGAAAESTAVTISGRTVTATFAAAAGHGQTVTITAIEVTNAARRIKDLAGNEAGTFDGTTATNNTPAPDTTAPSLVSATVNGLTATLTYDEELEANAVPALSFRFRVGTDASAGATAITISGRTVTLTLASVVTHGQTVEMQYTRQRSIQGDRPGIQDPAGNLSPDIDFGDDESAVTNDTPAPDTTVPQPETRTVNGSTVTLTYGEELDTNTVPASAFRFRVGTTGNGAAATAISKSGRTVTLTLASAVTHGQTVQMQYTRQALATAIKDLAGNRAPSISFGSAKSTVTNTTPAPDTTAPSLVSATVNGSTATLTYDEELEMNAVPALSFRFRVGTDASAGATAITISGRTVTLTLASVVTHGQTVEMQYTRQRSIHGDQPGIQDPSGNLSPDIDFGDDGSAVTNNTGTTPRPVSATVNGTTLTITLSHVLDTGSVPAASAFTVRGGREKGGARAGGRDASSGGGERQDGDADACRGGRRAREGHGALRPAGDRPAPQHRGHPRRRASPTWRRPTSPRRLRRASSRWSSSPRGSHDTNSDKHF